MPLAGFFLLFGCSTARISKFNDHLREDVFQNSFHGLVVMDAKTNKILYNTNGDRYFTPASNTKIATLFAGIKMLPQRFPTLKYVEKNDSVLIVPTGDPSWLHPYLNDSTALKFLKQKKNVAVYLNSFEDGRFGPGWAWEDFPYYFSAERSPLPLYGNVVSLSKVDSLEASPLVFLDSIQLTGTHTGRDEFHNRFYVHSEQQDTVEVPFLIKEGLTKTLLESVLKKEISLLDSLPSGGTETLYGIPSDSVYKRMMHVSDNFLAEQIMMTASSTLSDTLGIQRAIDDMLEKELSFLEHAPRWVDGSGLSRYNLFTPKSLVQILKKLHEEVDEERLFDIFPNWDSTGTISKWENPEMDPFIFAKSGSFGNNYNLSGYLKTKSGKLLIFSFMNNHFRVPSHEVRAHIHETLSLIHESH